MPESLSTLFNVMLMIGGFGLVIVVHEFGHFAAARWAGVRVHAFAVGFGSAICSWRRGLGFRWGSSEKEYVRLARGDAEAVPGPARAGAISPTEYRLNWFPFGGYVKMLGQEDLSPITASTSRDSFAAKPVWKRAIIMSGGVFMNLVLAGVLFVVAYAWGIREVAPIVGEVVPGSAAHAAGLRAGDRVLAIDGAPAHTFLDLRLAAAMAGRGRSLEVVVAREGEASSRTIAVTPAKGPQGTLEMGVLPAYAAHLVEERDLRSNEVRETYRRQLSDAGLGALVPGARLTAVGGVPLPPPPEDPSRDPARTPTADPLRAALESAAGAPVAATFELPGGASVEVSLRARAELQSGRCRIRGEDFAARHLLGLAPVMRVASITPRAAAAGLLPGDVFARIGAVEWPSLATGIAEVRAHAGGTIELEVVRDGARVSLRAPVGREGTIGFLTGDTSAESTRLGAAPGLRALAEPGSEGDGGGLFAASRLTPGIVPGSRILSVNGATVHTFEDVRREVCAATRRALDAGEGAAVTLRLALPALGPAGLTPEEDVALPLARADLEAVHALGWSADHVLLPFDLARFTDRAGDPWHALAKGVAKTHSVVLLTYVTFLRLFQGTVPVDQLHGPVGITHIGSQVAAEGFIYLVFFLGLISANLAVINFLPLPIVDGGHMVFLLIEGVTRRPVSAGVQNAAIVAGLLLVGTVFVVVTFNDLVRLLG